MNTIESLARLTQTLQKIDGAYAHATVRAFRADFTKFIRYCEGNEVDALPATPDTVALFVTHLSHKDFASAYIRRIIASISTIHKLNRCVDPTHDPDVKL
jgi:site-specific recombinase XerD